MEWTWPTVAALFIGATCFFFTLALAVMIGFAVWAARRPGL